MYLPSSHHYAKAIAGNIKLNRRRQLMKSLETWHNLVIDVLRWWQKFDLGLHRFKLSWTGLPQACSLCGGREKADSVQLKEMKEEF